MKDTMTELLYTILVDNFGDIYVKPGNDKDSMMVKKSSP